MSTGEAVRTFGVDISSMKRYVATARRVAGVWVSDSTVTRMPKHMGFSRRKDRWERARRVPKGGLARLGRRGYQARVSGLCRRDGHRHLACTPVCLVTKGRAGAL
jgi:hypothetical protein